MAEKRKRTLKGDQRARARRDGDSQKVARMAGSQEGGRKNGPLFVQVPFLLLKELRPAEVVVYMAILSRGYAGRGSSWASWSTIAADINMHRDTVRKLAYGLAPPKKDKNEGEKSAVDPSAPRPLLEIKARRSEKGGPDSNLFLFQVFVRDGEIIDLREGDGMGDATHTPHASRNQPPGPGEQEGMGQVTHMGMGDAAHGVGVKLPPKEDHMNKTTRKKKAKEADPRVAHALRTGDSFSDQWYRAHDWVYDEDAGRWMVPAGCVLLDNYVKRADDPCPKCSTQYRDHDNTLMCAS